MGRSFLVLWALVAVAACWRLDPVHRPLTGDNQLYFYLAERAASGVPPHVSHVDTKNQLGVLVTSTAIAAGRRLGVDDVLASRIVSIAFTAMSVALAAELATLLAGSAAAGHVAALALLAARGFAEHSAAGNNVKIFLVTFVLLAHVAMARGRRRGLAGLAAGAAFLCWQPALLVVAAVALEALGGRSGSLRRVAVVLVAALLPVAAYEAWFAVHGALGEQLRQAYAMTLGSVHRPSRLVRSLVYLFTEATGSSSPLRVGPTSFVVLGSGLLACLAWSPRRMLARLGARDGLLSFVVGAAGATAFTLYDHQGVPDLFFPHPYFAVATGLLVAVATLAAGRIVPAPAPLAVALAVMVALGWQMRRDDALRQPPRYDLDDQRDVASMVRGYHDSFGSVWVYGAVHLLGLAHLDNHVPYGLFYDDVESVVAVDEYLPLRDGRMPEVIVHGRGGVPGAQRYLGPDYVEITPEAFAAQSLGVWRRRAAGPRLAPG